MRTYFAIALGSALGGVSRYWLSEYLIRRAGSEFPWGTLAVNVSGSMLIGLFAAWSEALSLPARLFLMVGICGGYTTFSSFSLQTLLLLRAGALGAAASNALLSVLLCLGATWLGLWLGQAWHPLK